MLEVHRRRSQHVLKGEHLMAKEVLLVTGAGQIGLAIVRRMGYGKKIVIATRRPEKAQETLKTLTNAGFDAVVIPMDMASRESIVNAVKTAQEYGPIKMLVNAAGVSPSQATIEQILQIDLLGTAILIATVQGAAGSRALFRLFICNIESESTCRLQSLRRTLRPC